MAATSVAVSAKAWTATPANAGRRSSRRSSIGPVAVAWWAVKAPSRRTAAPSDPRIGALAHPTRLPRISVSSSISNPAVSSAAPVRSALRAECGRDSTSHTVASSPAAPTGTITGKTQRHPRARHRAGEVDGVVVAGAGSPVEVRSADCRPGGWPTGSTRGRGLPTARSAAAAFGDDKRVGLHRIGQRNGTTFAFRRQSMGSRPP